MNFEKFKKINDDRMNYREMEDATIVSSYRNMGCGDGYRIYLKIDEKASPKQITDASYTTTGCGFGLVSLAMVTQWAKGKSVNEAAKITAEDIERAFEFPPRRKNYPASAAECLRKAVADYHNGSGIRPEDCITRQSILEKLKKEGHLRYTDMRQVIFEKEDFSEVDFEGADLSHAFLTNCNFTGANFYKARLRGAFLNNANVERVNFRMADLRWAKLTGASLIDACFEDAVYDVGTRLDPHQTHLFSVMKKGAGAKDIYLKTEKKKEDIHV